MVVSFDDIENAFFFVSMDQMFMHSAYLCKETGEIFYDSEMGDSDELPEDIDDSEKYISIPHKNELDLGKALVIEFTSEYLPEELDKVYSIFRRKGAILNKLRSLPGSPPFKAGRLHLFYRPVRRK